MGNNFKIESKSAKDTISLGQAFSKSLKNKDVVVLEGALGGGKTTFVKGVLKGLGSRVRVLSPSFTLLRQYALGKKVVYHLDLYRLKSSDIFDLGVDDFLYSPDTIALIEWGDRIEKRLDKYIKIVFEFCGENIRRLEFSTKGYSGKRLDPIRRISKT